LPPTVIQDPATEEDMSSCFRPPIVGHAFGVLNRALFAKTVNLAAAAVADKKKIAQWRQALQKEKTMVAGERIAAVIPHPDRALASQGTRCLLLDPKVRPGGKHSFTKVIASTGNGE
jgi:tRNA (guanine37-N1)-methyltransferase